MKGRLLPLILALCLLLGGCGWLNGSYISVTPHEAPKQVSHADSISAANYRDFLSALKHKKLPRTDLVRGNLII